MSGRKKILASSLVLAVLGVLLLFFSAGMGDRGQPLRGAGFLVLGVAGLAGSCSRTKGLYDPLVVGGAVLFLAGLVSGVVDVVLWVLRG